MQALPSALPIPYDSLREFCERYAIRKMWLFGSVLREDFAPDSDIDVLVEFDPAHIPGWEFYGRWPEELSAMLGRPVDLSTPDSLRPWIKPTIMNSAQVIYERPE